MKQKIHLGQSISGALRNWTKKDWEAQGAHNAMTGAQLKERFRIMEFEGKKVVPMSGKCEGFSYETGCPGHPEEEV